MCENNPCTYSTLCEDWSLFTGNYCFYKENLAWQLYGLEFHEASSQRKQLLHLTQFAAVLKTPISSDIHCMDNSVYNIDEFKLPVPPS